MTTHTPIENYTVSKFTAPIETGDIIEHDVYRLGTGAPIILIQELPGIGVETLKLADEFVNNGFQVVLPHLFGPIGKTAMGGNLARVFCMRKEFKLFQSNRSSPIVDWLKALCQEVRKETGAEGVGVIGMCLTGNFAISLMADDSVLAAVSAQPAMPFSKQQALHMSDTEIVKVIERIDETAPIQAYRFEDDAICSAKKFNLIDQTFNKEGKQRVELNTLPGKGHSVVTLDFVDEPGHPTRKALNNILDYFKTQLIY